MLGVGELAQYWKVETYHEYQRLALAWANTGERERQREGGREGGREGRVDRNECVCIQIG